MSAAADIDFETRSAAGFVWDSAGIPRSPLGRHPSAKRGLPLVGAWCYAEHESTEVLCLHYRLPDGISALWVPGWPPPTALFHHITEGLPVRAHNASFEYAIWENVCRKKHGWPPLPLEQLDDSAAQARAWALPGSLESAALVLGLAEQKDAAGAATMRKLSVPRRPTKNDKSPWHTLESDPDGYLRLYSYCAQDTATQRAVAGACPPVPEPALFRLDQQINQRGVAVDTGLAVACQQIITQAARRYTEEIRDITRGAISGPGQVQAIGEYLRAGGTYIESLDAEAVADALSRPTLPPEHRRILEIRAAMSSASVKKLPALLHQTARDGRIRNLFTYCGAGRTRRWSGSNLQPQNLPSAGPETVRCQVCGTVRWAGRYCCGGPAAPLEWGIEAMEAAIGDLQTGDLAYVQGRWGDALTAIAGCLRGMLIAGPGLDLICSDFSAIEAVVLAALAREDWRLEVFRTHGKIYEMSASKITGIPFEEFTRHKRETGQHHPMRKKVGKVAELASGYQGSVGAWKRFGADEFMDDDEILRNVRAWREASPRVVELWYALERCAIGAVQNPGTEYRHNDIRYVMRGGVLYCLLPSGGYLSYHRPRLEREETEYGPRLKLSFWGWNTNPENGPVNQWIESRTYGGRLAENLCQATARDWLACAMLRLDAAGYPIVLHVHDEVCAEVPQGWGSVEDFERVMGGAPAWGADWPIKAAGGWRGHRYRKG